MQEQRVYKIALFAGTTEGRRLSELLAQAGIAHTVCVATEYGKILLNRSPLVCVCQGRMDKAQIEDFLREGGFTLVIDATHPFAREVTRNLKEAVEEQSGKGMDVSYLRLKRKQTEQQERGVVYFENNEECARALERTEGNILLTTGSKEISRYCKNEGVKNRLYVRILPSMESLALCMEQGIGNQRVIAMQGPFTSELNEALLFQYHISYVVTKESGAQGGYPEKLEAAQRAGAHMFVIGRPKEEEGFSFAQICARLERLCNQTFPEKEPVELTLAGIGMGKKDGMTKEAESALHEADILFGAERILADIPGRAKKYPFYRPEQIIPCLQEVQEMGGFMESLKIVVLFSGDSGFYSGCQALYARLEEEIRKGSLKASLRILPGISSVSYLAACAGVCYHDAAVYSIHGKEICNLAKRIKRSPKTFLLTSGVRDVNRIGKALFEAGMEECEVITGYQMSYEEQRIMRLTPKECMEIEEEGLYTCLVMNPHVSDRKLTHGIGDEAFLRGNVPMTKEEAREVGICKLRLQKGAVVYDIGSGTGSVAAEIAGLSDDIQVYAVEYREEAVSLIVKNMDRLGLDHVKVVRDMAPEGLSCLPKPTQAFIGGSGGRLKEILAVLWKKNPKMRIVIHAVSIETICEIKELLSVYPIKEEEIVQLQVSRAKRAGNHHLMRAENPVWICGFTFDGEVQEGGSYPDCL